jgi:drug/metabolite transporter (DMT)-like permease
MGAPRNSIAADLLCNPQRGVQGFSLAYPIMRGLNPVFVTALGVTFLGDKLNTYGACGVALIAVGIVVSAFSRKAGQLHLSLPLLLTCVSASVLVSLFLLVDGIGVRSTTHDHPGSYAAAMAVLDGLVSGGIVVGLRQFRKRRFSLGEIRQSVAGGLLASVAFWIGIWAISVAPIGMVSALRETSIFFALLLSIVFLKEKLTAGRAFGVASILVGVILIRAGG